MRSEVKKIDKTTIHKDRKRAGQVVCCGCWTYADSQSKNRNKKIIIYKINHERDEYRS